MSTLPAQRFDAQGVARVDARAVIALALPLFLNSSLQAVLNLTDTWFIGRISADAVAGIGAVYWLILAAFIFLGGIAIAVQTLAAQAYGARRKRQASHAMWMGVWGSLATVPIFLALAFAGPWILSPIGLEPNIQAMALEYWGPRMAGGGVSVALWSMLSFLNGIGRVKVSFIVNAIVVIANTILNEVLMFQLGWGIAGSAWATTAALAIGMFVAIGMLARRRYRREYAIDRTWRPRRVMLKRVFALGLPTGLFITFDILAMAVFQLIQVRLGAVDGAATQISMMLTSVAFMPAVGIGMAGTTLVGQSIGAGDKDWALRIGNAVIIMCVVYMTICGALLALSAPWLMPFFVAASDPRAAEVIALGITLMWIAAAYQFFDGLNLGSGFCLRGAGDARVPAIALALIGWLVFLPLAHALAFAPGQGWIASFPAWGYGAAGGWVAAVVYVSLLGMTLYVRWRSKAWQRLVWV